MQNAPSTFPGARPVDGLFQSILSLPFHAIAYHAGLRLRDGFPGKYILQCSACSFDLDGFVEAGHALCRYREDGVFNEVLTTWKGCNENGPMGACWTQETGIRRRALNAFLTLEWQGTTFEVLCLSWRELMREQRLFFILGPDRGPVDAFFEAVTRWTSTPHGEVLVFEQGNWRKDPNLFESIRATIADDLVLPPGFKEQIFEDVAQFFARREIYVRHGVPWKRGLLFLGPPGNGKTHAVKAICHVAGKPVLYVRSLESAGMFSSGEHANVSQVFDLARRTAPCLLVLEDLDSLIKPNNRSVFLNELDGFAQNTGLCVVATTNYPERLDPSILDRPSRFDRKYTFDLPTQAGRRAYLERWSSQQSRELQISQPGIEAITAATEEFSYAYLKELCLATAMAWINAGPGTSPDTIALAQAHALQAQRRSAPTEAPAPPPQPTDAENLMAILDRMT
ncbi:MAG: ATP-binding protein [Verrucomicrobiales bacterium]|nr:ATP-binding protein [Verrucomicrobiales bacterium]